MSAERERFDVAVVGAGVIGLSVAFRLARRGRSVVVLDRGEALPRATPAAAGMLAPVSEAEDAPAALVEAGLVSLRRYASFLEELESLGGSDCGYRRDGTLWVALDRDDGEELERLSRRLAERELPAEALGREAVEALEPHLTHRVVAALRVAGDHQLDPRALAASLATAFRRSGGTLRTGARVTRVIAGSGRVRGVLWSDGRDERRVDAARVVLAGGAWSGRDVELPVEAPAVRPVKGEMVRLRGAELLDHVVRTPRVYLVPRRGGELLVGATAEERGFDGAPSAGAVMELLRHAWEVLPGCDDLTFESVEVGLRPATADQLPLVGPTEVEGLFLATGHYRNGVLLAPATADALATWMLDDRAESWCEPFHPARAARRRARA